jgi:hypothetical protein
MKKIIILLILFITNLSNSQNDVKNKEFTDWKNPKSFEKFGLKKVTSYSIKLNKKGKIKNDSLLLSEHNYNNSNSVVYGTFHYFVVTSHVGTHLEFYNFKNNYSKDGLLLKKTNTKISKEKKRKEELEFNTNFEIFEYDSLKRKTKETFYEESNTIRFYDKDTSIYFKSIYNPKITEYKYDSKSRIIKQFASQDSATYFYKSYNQKEFKSSKKIGYYEPKYLQQEWNYDEDNLTKHINYTYKKEVHTKRYYYYNSTNQIIKKIDSTGFYYTKPYLSSITEFIYSDKTKTEIETNFDRDSYYKKVTNKYNLDNQLIYEFLEAETSNYNTERNFEYSNNLKTITTKHPHNMIQKEIFLYDKRGLLIEKKEYYNEILTELIKYYYE